MPFVTEELWQRLPKSQSSSAPESLMIASYPQPNPAWDGSELDAQMTFLSSIATGVGKLRTDYKLAPSKRPTLILTCSDLERARLIETRSLEVTTLASAGSLQVSKARCRDGYELSVTEPSASITYSEASCLCCFHTPHGM